MIRDFLGNELNVGDTVIYGTPMGSGRGFRVGIIEKFTPKMVSVSNIIPKAATSTVYAVDLLKIDPEQVTHKLLCQK